MPTQFHLAWFVANGFGVQGFRGGWDDTWSGTNGRDYAKADLYVDMARSLERAGFDYMMLEDSSNVPYTYGGTHDIYTKHAIAAPKHDPSQLAPILAYATQKLGIVATLSTSEYHPYMLARQISTLDHLAEGRGGWNIVTGSNDGTAQNYGFDGHYPHDERYDRADEFVDVVRKLLASWEADAIVMDRETGTFADGSKIHAIHHDGQYYRSRGPLNVSSSPQGQPVFCQAGGSPRGREFAAANADTIIGSANGISEMKAFREDVHERMVRLGRNPSDCKILFLIDPVLGETAEHAKDRKAQAKAELAENFEREAANFARITGIDYATMDPDLPLPELKSNGHQSSLEARIKAGAKTVRELVMSRSATDALGLVGTPDAVASEMGDVMDEVGGDGYLFGPRTVNRRSIAEITDGLVPELQRRGLTRMAYEYDTFRENLLAF
ncbi:MAG: NtaA/DmoA family FMN-dependent monooxygenase [Microbacterium sp.]|uniref:NtaA/DmoA family FMN-dependent monooxygenase n=1 Tax=Microbacterium sp. TaxID=51671 RepID=UPI0027281C89|nr:NtaA/DmoA family FMN-dependent monooxygenase [Microbacterium sp.]MDO8382843.1 NtaA/DmoA family FMN-dependent monooxygenase [Microbacterium sp.]